MNSRETEPCKKSPSRTARYSTWRCFSSGVAKQSENPTKHGLTQRRGDNTRKKISASPRLCVSTEPPEFWILSASPPERAQLHNGERQPARQPDASARASVETSSRKNRSTCRVIRLLLGGCLKKSHRLRVSQGLSPVSICRSRKVAGLEPALGETPEIRVQSDDRASLRSSPAIPGSTKRMPCACRGGVKRRIEKRKRIDGKW